jgi:hypothetical protein
MLVDGPFVARQGLIPWWSREQSSEEPAVEVSKLAREGRFDYLLAESTGILEPLPVAEPRLGRWMVLTFPLFPPPQKN